MAKIGLGVTVSQIRGSVGGGTFSKAKNGATLRTRIAPRNPNSDAQAGIRADMTASSRAFKALSSTNLALWQAYANGVTINDPITGSSYHPSAISAYNKLNVKKLQADPGSSNLTAPPTSPFAGDTTVVTATGGAGEVDFAFSADNGAGIVTELLLQPLISANRAPNPNGYRTQMFVTGDSATPSVVDHLASDFLHPTSPLPAGEYIPAYRFVKTATGEATQLVVLPAVTVS